MISLPDGISRDDIGQWLYGGVCIHIAPNGVSTPAVMDRVTEDRSGATKVRIRLMGDGFIEPVSVYPSELRGHWPMCGSINVEQYHCAVHVERIPARQYKRTFNSRQVKFMLPRMWDVRKRFGSAVSASMTQASPGVVGSLFNPTYPESYEAALEMLGSGWLSVALNPRIIVAGDDLGKRMVYYRGELAVTINGEWASPVADTTTCRIINRALKGRYSWTTAI